MRELMLSRGRWRVLWRGRSSAIVFVLSWIWFAYAFLDSSSGMPVPSDGGQGQAEEDENREEDQTQPPQRTVGQPPIINEDGPMSESDDIAAPEALPAGERKCGPCRREGRNCRPGPGADVCYWCDRKGGKCRPEGPEDLVQCEKRMEDNRQAKKRQRERQALQRAAQRERER